MDAQQLRDIIGAALPCEHIQVDGDGRHDKFNLFERLVNVCDLRCLLLADPAVHQAARLVKGARNLRQALDQGQRDPVPGLADGLEAEADVLDVPVARRELPRRARRRQAS